MLGWYGGCLPSAIVRCHSETAMRMEAVQSPQERSLSRQGDYLGPSGTELDCGLLMVLREGRRLAGQTPASRSFLIRTGIVRSGDSADSASRFQQGVVQGISVVIDLFRYAEFHQPLQAFLVLECFGNLSEKCFELLRISNRKSNFLVHDVNLGNGVGLMSVVDWRAVYDKTAIAALEIRIAIASNPMKRCCLAGVWSRWMQPPSSRVGRSSSGAVILVRSRPILSGPVGGV